MAVKFSAADYFTRSDGVVTGLPVTLSVRRFGTGGATNYYLVALGNSVTGTPIIALYADGSTGNYFLRDDAGTSTIPNASASGPAEGSWSHFAGVSSATNSHQCWMNGVPGTVSTTNLASTFSCNTTSLAALKRTAGAENPLNGSLADAAIWNCALTGSEIRLLAQGISPLMIRPANLVWYVPMNDAAYPAIDVMRGRNVSPTAGSPTLFPHPRTVRRYYKQRLFGVTAAGGSFQPFFANQLGGFIGVGVS